MKQKYHVTLSESDRFQLLKKASDSKTTKSIRKRCNVLLQADESVGKVATQKEIAIRCGVCPDTVHILMKDFNIHGLDYCLRECIRETPSNPPIVTGEKEARIIALACGSAPDGRSRWTVRLLAEKVVELNIMETVSHETIRTTLKKHNLSLI